MVALVKTLEEGDKLINCVDCKEDFVWVKDEQEFYAKNGLYPPKRCKPDRRKKRAKYLAENGFEDYES